MALLSNILTWWSGTRVPSVSQRQATFNSFRHKDDLLPMSEVDGLEDVLNTKANIGVGQTIFVEVVGVSSYLVPAGTLIRCYTIIDTVPLTFSIGTTEGGKQYIEDAPIVAGADVLDVPKYFRKNTTIYFTGITPQTIIRITKG